MLSDRQRHVLENLDRLSTDGARHDARYELDGACVSMQVRALIDKGLLVLSEHGRLSKGPISHVRTRATANPNAVDEMRRLLLG